MISSASIFNIFEMLFYICFVAQEKRVGRSGRAAEEGAKRNLTLRRVGGRSKDDNGSRGWRRIIAHQRGNRAHWRRGMAAKKGPEPTCGLTRGLCSELGCLEDPSYHSWVLAGYPGVKFPRVQRRHPSTLVLLDTGYPSVPHRV